MEAPLEATEHGLVRNGSGTLVLGAAPERTTADAQQAYARWSPSWEKRR